MKTDSLKIITLEELKQHKDLVVYTSENVTILNDITKIIRRNHHVAKLGCMMMVFCEEGTASLHINGNIHLLKKGNCAILTPGTVIQSYSLGNELTSKIFAVSNVSNRNVKFKKGNMEHSSLLVSPSRVSYQPEHIL